MEKDSSGACLDLDARFAVADSCAQLVLSGGSFHGDRDLAIDVAGTRTRVEPETRIRRNAKGDGA